MRRVETWRRVRVRSLRFGEPKRMWQNLRGSSGALVRFIAPGTTALSATQRVEVVLNWFEELEARVPVDWRIPQPKSQRYTFEL